MSPDIHTLAGAYAANALPPDEQRLFEEHLAACAACNQEVAELRATAARLAGAVEQAPPPALKDRVLAQVDQTRQERPAGGAAGVGIRTAPRSGGRWLLPVAAALAAVAIGLGVVATTLNARLDEAQAFAARLVEVLEAPDVRMVDAEGPDGMLARVAMSHTRGQAAFMAFGMDPAPHEHVYELWLIHASGATPAGLFDVDAHGRVTQLLAADMTGVAAIGVTVEPAGGSPQPTTDPVLVVDLAD